MTIDTTWDTTWSDQFDLWIEERYPHRPPLQRDPELAEALAPRNDDTECAGCGVDFRPKGTSPDEHPGTVLHCAKGKCRKCYDDERRPSTRRHVRGIPSHCFQCSVTIRPRDTPLADAPGTVSYGAQGLCKTCYLKKRNEARSKGIGGRPRRNDVPKTADGCRSCGLAMRPRGTKLADYPNTVPLSSKGMCHTCYTSRGPKLSVGGAS